MARGGSRPGAGRPRLSDEERAARAAARKAAAKAKPATKKKPSRKGAIKKAKESRTGYSPNGVKNSDAPAGWPFGTQPPAPEPPPAAAPIDPDGDPVIPGGAPLDFLRAVINETRLKLAVRLQAAALAAPFVHAKPAPQGKKDGKVDAAKSAGAGKFAAAAPPLKLVKR